MTAIVTGAAGFVGLNLLEALLARGQSVVSISNRSIPPTALAAFASLPGRLTTVEADILRTENLAELFRRHEASCLFPLAALTPSAACEAAQPEAIVSTNVTALIAQLRAARDARIARVVVPSSVAVYGGSAFGPAPLAEAETPCLPGSLYAVTKQAAELASLRLAELWSLDLVVARIGNVFGRWEHRSGARETFGAHFQLFEMAARGIEAVLPERLPRSSAIYSRDLAAALIHLSAIGERSHDVYNVCSGDDWSEAVPLWAEQLRQVYPAFRWRRSPDPAAVNLRLPEERPRALIDISRLRQAGWSPAYRQEAAYRDYAEWVRSAGFIEAADMPAAVIEDAA